MRTSPQIATSILRRSTCPLRGSWEGRRHREQRLESGFSRSTPTNIGANQFRHVPGNQQEREPNTNERKETLSINYLSGSSKRPTLRVPPRVQGFALASHPSNSPLNREAKSRKRFVDILALLTVKIILSVASTLHGFGASPSTPV